MVNPSTEYIQLIISQLPHGGNYRKVKIFNHMMRKNGANSRSRTGTVRDFNCTVRKNLSYSDKYRAMDDTVNHLPVLFIFNIENVHLKFLIPLAYH
jgi:hypothetical protein